MQETNTAVSKKNKIIRNTALILFSVVLLLTFFSNTINNLLLPEVICSFPSNGILAKSVNATGEVKAMNMEKIYSYGDWRVEEIRVKPGDVVSKGDILAVIDLSDSLLEVKRLELDIANMEFELRKFKRSTGTIDIAVYEKDVALALKKLEKGEENLENIKLLYDSGAETLKNVRQAEEELENAKNDYSDKEKLLSNKRKESASNSEDNLDYIEQKTLEINQKKLEIEAFKRKIPVNGEIKSNVTGIVAGVEVNTGSYSSRGQLMLEVAEEEKGFNVEWKLNSSKAELLDTGNEVEFTVNTSEKSVYNTKIKVKRYIPEEDSYLFVSESLKADGKLHHGQKVDMEAVSRSQKYSCIVPASSIFELNGTDHIYVLEEREGILGVENYVKEIRVMSQDSDGLETAISVTLEAEEKVVEYSTKALSDGMQVKLR